MPVQAGARALEVARLLPREAEVGGGEGLGLEARGAHLRCGRDVGEI